MVKTTGIPLWIWNIIIAVIGILGIAGTIQCDNTPLMGTTGLLILNTLGMSVIFYKIQKR